MPSIKIMTWNVLNFNGSKHKDSRREIFEVITNENPDILVVEEIKNTAGFNVFKAGLSGYSYFWQDQNAAQDIAIFWKTDKFTTAVDPDVLDTKMGDGNRNCMWVRLKAKFGSGTKKTIDVVGVHLQSSPGRDNERERLGEVNKLLAELHLEGADEKATVVLGDFNIYSSNEPAFNAFINADFEDPATGTRAWKGGVATHKKLFTQSTRKTADQGRDHSPAAGGLNDRFDFILTRNWNFDTPTIRIPGNDGSIPFGAAVPGWLDMSDHLPVVMVFNW